MERLSNRDSMVTQLWNPISLMNPEHENDTFSKTLVQPRATWYKVPEGIYNQYRHQSIPEERVLRPYIVSLYGEAE
jgi:hypothetical protein